MKKEYIFRLVLGVAIFFLVYQFGVKPIFNISEKDNTVGRQDWSVQLSKGSSADYDVIVSGAEPQGVAAAVSAARLGARTLLISEGKDAGGTIVDCLLPELEVPVGQENRLLNGGILEELYNKLGTEFSDKKYISTVEELLKAEKGLSVLYNTSIIGASMTGGNIDSIEVLTDGEKKVVTGRMFIDASDNGSLLDACQVPYFTGSGDLNMNDSFMPVGLNFEMEISDYTKERISEVKKLINNKNKFYKGLKEYIPININTRIDGLTLYFTGEQSLLFSGLQMSGVNVLNENEMNNAYTEAVAEAKNLAFFISKQFEQFNGWTFTRAAQSMRVKESKHYIGKYTLTVNDILDNRFFEDTVAMGSYPIVTSKFADSGLYIAGKGVQYGIPLGCLVPEKTANLMMAGPRISYSSLAATSAGTLGSSIATGEAAGTAAVFYLVKNESPAFLVKGHEKFDELVAILASWNMYLPNKNINSRKTDNWSYPAARQLVSLGLVAGGSKNNLNYNVQAKQKDLSFILINGIFRLDKSSYSLELDARIRPFINDESLTFSSVMSILGALYDVEGGTDAVYEKLCAQSHINDVMQLRMKERKTLTMDDVYYLGAYTIRSYTGKDIPD